MGKQTVKSKPSLHKTEKDVGKVTKSSSPVSTVKQSEGSGACLVRNSRIPPVKTAEGIKSLDTQKSVPEPQPYVSTDDLKLYYFGSKTYERNEKPKINPSVSKHQSGTPKKVSLASGKSKITQKRTEGSKESSSVTEISTDDLIASAQLWTDFYDSL